MKRTLFGIMGIMLALLVLGVPGVQADTYDGAWAPGELDFPTSTIDLTLSVKGTGSLYLYEYGTPTNNILLLADNSYFDYLVGIDFEYVNSNWNATSINPLTSVTQTLTMHDGRTESQGPIFGFFFSSDGNSNTIPYTIEYIESIGSYKITDPTSSMMVEVKNASPVPLPGTLALLFPCILGILGIGWRKNREV